MASLSGWRVRGVVDELEHLARHRADRELRAAEQRLDELGDADPEEAGAVVVDEDGNLQQAGGRARR